MYDPHDATYDGSSPDEEDDSEDVTYLDVTGNLVKYVHVIYMHVHQLFECHA